MKMTLEEVAQFISDNKDNFKCGNYPEGFIKIGSGCYRIVFKHVDYPEVVFKLEKAEEGEFQNKIEVETFKETPEEKRSTLSAILYHLEDFSVIVHEFIQGLRLGDMFGDYSAEDMVIKEIKKLHKDIQDIHSFNVLFDTIGIRYVLVDYGRA